MDLKLRVYDYGLTQDHLQHKICNCIESGLHKQAKYINCHHYMTDVLKNNTYNLNTTTIQATRK